jgi:hypothetical protein
MRSLLVALILLTSICPTFELGAQTLSPYTFSLKGRPSPYDSAVIIQIAEYRKIRIKVTTADSLVDALSTEINQLLTLVDKQDQANRILVDLTSRQEATISRKEETIEDLSDQFDRLYEKSVSKKKFYQTNGFKYGAGGIGALLIRKALINLAQ